jgi:acetamidase/formamidase
MNNPTLESKREHVIDRKKIHHRWQRELEPALAIQSGEVIHFDLLMAGYGQVREGARIEQVTFDWETMYNLSGPVYVDGAQPGDTLEIEILKLVPGEWGWTAFLPELGLLPEDFANPYLKTFNLRSRESALVAAGVEIPLAPFPRHDGEPSWRTRRGASVPASSGRWKH